MLTWYTAMRPWWKAVMCLCTAMHLVFLVKPLNGQPVKQGSWLSFTRITRDKAGDYICHGSNTCGRTNSSVRSIDVQYKPENVTLNVNITISNNKVCADVAVNFTCTAEEANPAPHTYTLFRNESPVVQNMASPGVWIRRLNTAGEVTYRCGARNSISNDISSNTTFTVEVPASVTVENDTLVVKEGSNVTLFCHVSGFPSPSVSWVNNRSELMEAGNIWRIPNIRRNCTGEYNCVASNACGNDSKRAVIVVQYSPSDTGSGQNGSVYLGSSVSFTCSVDGNPEPNITWYKGSNAGGTVLFSGKTLNFTETKADDTGCYTCSASNFLGTVSITQCRTVVLPPTTTKPVGPTSATPTTKTTSKPTDDTEQDGPPWVVIGCVVGGVVVLVIVIAVVTWWLHKKRKCRKDTKISHCESEAQVLQEGAADESAYSQVNQEYAGSGPPSANGTDGSGQQQAAAAVPTYAVVDKSKKKKNQQEEKPPEYAVVDKSKKKKKKKKKDEKEDYTFAEADKSKKTSKKQQPRNADGLIYADLENIQRPQMPPVSTSPNALPPVKRPPAYEGTQYADITEFFKGDATLPKEGNSQVVEMQPQPRQ